MLQRFLVCRAEFDSPFARSIPWVLAAEAYLQLAKGRHPTLRFRAQVGMLLR